jgi:hypothetical protein
LAPLANLKFTWTERFQSLKGVYGIMILFSVVVGGIYGGYFPATYAGAVGAFGAFVIALARRKLTPGSLIDVLKEAAVTTSVIFIIVVGGILFARFLTYSGLVTTISSFMIGLGADKYTYLLCFVVLFTILGCFIEPIAIMVRKDDAGIKKLGNDVIAGLVRSGDMAKLWDKWFVQPIPPKNVKVGLALSESTKAAWAAPNDKPMEDYAKK